MAISARFKADFGLFRPFRSLVDTDRYGLIHAENSGQISLIRRESTRIEAELAQIKSCRREYDKKKKKSLDAASTRGQPRRTLRPASDSGAAPSQPRLCFTVHC